MKNPAPVTQRLKARKGLLHRIFEQVHAQARAASGSSTGTLFGMLGGFIGCAIAYALPFYTMATFAGLGPILAGLGIVAGVLAWRGPGHINQERQQEQALRWIDESREELLRLPKNAPQEAKDAATARYVRALQYDPLSGAGARLREGGGPQAVALQHHARPVDAGRYHANHAADADDADGVESVAYRPAGAASPAAAKEPGAP